MNVPVRLERRRIFILPTAHGVAFALALAVMLVGSINYNNGLGHALTFLLASLALVSMLHAYRNLAGLALSAGEADPVHVGAIARLHVHVDNRDAGARTSLLLRYRAPGGDEAVVRFSLRPGELRRVELPVPARRRGRLRIESLTVATRYPFGLFRAWSPLDLAPEGLVYPRPAGARTLPPSGSDRGRDDGMHGRGREDFTGFRDYVPGDSPRQIHWKAVAREQGIPVKLFSGAAGADLELRWEDAPGAGVEARLSQLCRWVLEADARACRYALSLPGTRVPMGAGAAQREACLTALALHGEEHAR